MEAIGNVLNAKRKEGKDYQERLSGLFENPKIRKFIEENQLSKFEQLRSSSKFNEYLVEREKFLEKSENPESVETYEPVLILNEGFADVAYRPTKALLLKQENQERRKRIRLIGGLSAGLKDILWADVFLDDVNRKVPYQALSNLIAQGSKGKGVYLYGDFGTGKSFMMAAMANSLAELKIDTTLVHYPTFVAESDYNNYRERVEQLKTASVLILDDIGAEINNSWTRDNLLQVILQHRMDNQMPTSFTSNLSFEDLEQHFAETKNLEDRWPAQRIMERIKYLAQPIHLKGENRRHG